MCKQGTKHASRGIHSRVEKKEFCHFGAADQTSTARYVFLVPPPFVTPPALPFLPGAPLPLAGFGGSFRLPPAVDDFIVTGPKKDSRRPAKLPR